MPQCVACSCSPHNVLHSISSRQCTGGRSNYERKLKILQLYLCCFVKLLMYSLSDMDKNMLLHVQSFSWCLLIWQVTENAGLVRMNSASTMFPLILGLPFVKRIPSGGTSGKTGKENIISHCYTYLSFSAMFIHLT